MLVLKPQAERKDRHRRWNRCDGGQDRDHRNQVRLGIEAAARQNVRIFFAREIVAAS